MSETDTETGFMLIAVLVCCRSACLLRKGSYGEGGKNDTICDLPWHYMCCPHCS